MATVKGIWVFNEKINNPFTIGFNYFYVTGEVVTTSGTVRTISYFRFNDNNPTLSYQSSDGIFYAYNDGEWLIDRTVDFGTTEQTVSDEFYTWLTANAVQQGGDSSEPTDDTLYIINGSTLTAIADAIRAKHKSTMILTPEKMPEEISKIVDAESMPNAEDAYFGTQSSEEVEYAIISNSGIGYMVNKSGQHYGNDILINETFSLLGFQVYDRLNTNFDIKIWDTDTLELIAELTVKTGSTNVWTDQYLSKPVNLVAGKRYTISQAGSYFQGFHYKHVVTFSPKVTYENVLKIGATGECPTEVVTGENEDRSAVGFLIGPAITETEIAEYKIQTQTMYEIANELKRISGLTGTVNIEQMLEILQSITLQDKTVTPTAEVQTITPDDGYIGLSSVTVGAITEGNQAVVEIVDEKMEVVANDTY